MIDRLFTVICEFRGGTYIAQISAADEREAVVNWAEHLRKTRPVRRSSSHLAKAVLTNAKREHPVTIEGISGVWCFTAFCGGDLMIAHIVETVRD